MKNGLPPDSRAITCARPAPRIVAAEQRQRQARDSAWRQRLDGQLAALEARGRPLRPQQGAAGTGSSPASSLR